MTKPMLLDHIDPSRLPLGVALNDSSAPTVEPGMPTPRATENDTDYVAALAAFSSDPRGRRFLAHVAAHSDYLSALIRRDGDVFARIVVDGPDAELASALGDLTVLDETASGASEVMTGLRRAKRRVALAVAIADILGLWTLEKVTGALTDLAEATLEQATRRAMREWRGDPTPRGLTVLGLGKLGSRELNYSSDIDIIVLYEPDRLQAKDPGRLRQDMVRVTRSILRLMDERTRDGYVFRTDLRLRPDPSATPIAMTVAAAETYYESVGQNWERAAMIKARPVAGDRALGEDFLTHIRPFVWRKYLDFAAIQDIHSIKRQINAHRGGATVAVEGHNIKIGRGGIREIEFFAQTQQLIWGGRQPDLRVRGTVDALNRLAETGHADADTVAALSDTYVFLRTLEHRLQMVADQQTQTLPTGEDEIAAIGRFMGFEDPAAFRADVRRRLTEVAEHYARLFEESADLGAGGSLVFTGTEDDPDTLETLTRMGFADPSHLTARVRVWHHGRYRATRSERARQLLTELMPRLLKALADTATPDDAFQRFDNFLSGLPSGVQLFSLFQAHPLLLDMVCEILGGAPRLADWMARKPILLDAVLGEAFFEPVTEDTWSDGTDDDLAEALGFARDFQDVLDTTRRWANDRKFRVGVHLLRGLAQGDRVGPALSGIAETALAAVLSASEADFAAAHGRCSGDGLVVVAFGKLGGRELLPESDLDLVFVYDVDAACDASDGDRPIGPQVYHLRLCQRLVTAIETETGEGRLYQVDTRLRPSGTAGPLATQLAGFGAYYDLADGDAWTWEHMALTRARTVYGPEPLRRRVDALIRERLCQRRDAAVVLPAVASMRERVAREFPAKTPWDVKYREGGLVDVEFVAQTLQILHAAEAPDVLAGNTGAALANLRRAGLLSDPHAEALLDAHGLWMRLQAAIRLTTPGGVFDEVNAPHGQKAALARAAGVDRFEDLAPRMAAAATAAYAAFREIVDQPAGAFRPGTDKETPT
jgi:glutamate-ammonia-ligase adenylyltransferase